MKHQDEEMTPEQLRRWQSLFFRVLGWYVLAIGLVSAFVYFFLL